MNASEHCQAIEELKAQGLTQRAIAMKLGIAQSTVSKYLGRAALVDPAPDWGLGRAELVEPVGKGSTETVLFVSDWHVPYEDKEMMHAAISLAQDLQPDRVVFNGDMSDFFQLSRFNTGLEQLDTLQDDINQTNAYRGRFRRAVPNATLDETEGNHDERIRTYVQTKARPLTSLKALQPSNLFDWGKNEINPHGGNGFLLRPQFLVKHGTIVRGEAGATAKAELAAAGISGVSGHTHRLAGYEKTGYVQREWWEGGCLCRLDPDYVKGSVPNWKSGCLVGLFSNRTEHFVIEPVQRLGNSLIFGGRIY